MFRNAEIGIARQVCERIADAVRGFDWSAVAPGLQSGISVGVATAQPQDTVETLPHRDDAAMYQHKKRRRA